MVALLVFLSFSGPTSFGAPTNKIQAICAAGVDPLFRLSNRIYSGAAPEGDAGFETLRNLGIKTIITVDGTKPDLARAHKYGFRYVHLPHGYDGIDTNTQFRLIKAARKFPGPIYVHCHHGKHRGPAAAAVICMGTEGWSPVEGLDWLKMAGTATNYTGLFKTVENFHRPTAKVLAGISSDFPEVTEPGKLVDTMVLVDSRWDGLQAFKKSEFKPPRNHPDFDAAAEVQLLVENFREAQRLPEAKDRGKEFLKALKHAEAAAREIGTNLGSVNATDAKAHLELNKALEQMGNTCGSCHKQFRN